MGLSYRLLLLPLLFLQVSLAISWYGSRQYVNIQGRIFCFPPSEEVWADHPEVAEVELWEWDRWDPNDLLGKTRTINGLYSVNGSEREWGSISPFLRIEYMCPFDEGTWCKYTVEIDVPKKYVSKNENYRHPKPFDIILYNLRGSSKGGCEKPRNPNFVERPGREGVWDRRELKSHHFASPSASKSEPAPAEKIFQDTTPEPVPVKALPPLTAEPPLSADPIKKSDQQTTVEPVPVKEQSPSTKEPSVSSVPIKQTAQETTVEPVPVKTLPPLTAEPPLSSDPIKESAQETTVELVPVKEQSPSTKEPSGSSAPIKQSAQETTVEPVPVKEQPPSTSEPPASPKNLHKREILEETTTLQPSTRCPDCPGKPPGISLEDLWSKRHARLSDASSPESMEEHTHHHQKRSHDLTEEEDRRARFLNYIKNQRQ